METTTTRTVTSYDTSYDDYGKQIRSSIQPRHLVIQKRGNTPLGGSNMVIERSTRYSTTSGAPGSGAVVATGINNVKSSRDKEKKDMQDLNERFASYIEKVRFLEAQNRKLDGELEKLKSKWGKETTQIKGLYQAELDEAKRLLEEAQKEKSRLEMRIAALEDQLANLRSKLDEKLDANRNDRDRIEQQNQQMSDIEAELNLLRRRAELLDADRDKAKKTIARLQDALNRCRIDIDNETLLQVDAENRRQALEDELEFLKSIHEQELKELADLAYRDTTSENREFWKNEMGPALREIQMKSRETGSASGRDGYFLQPEGPGVPYRSYKAEYRCYPYQGRDCKAEDGHDGSEEQAERFGGKERTPPDGDRPAAEGERRETERVRG
jgi:hypothetical protein